MTKFEARQYNATGSQYAYEVHGRSDGTWRAIRRPHAHRSVAVAAEWLCTDNTWRREYDMTEEVEMAFYPNEHVAISHIYMYSNDLD